MQRHCGTCGMDYDDESFLSICPHSIGERAEVSPSNPTMDAMNDVIVSDLEDLMWEWGPRGFFLGGFAIFPHQES